VSQNWQVGHVHSYCEYSLEVADGIYADVDLYVGLKSINITLRGSRISPSSVIMSFEVYLDYVGFEPKSLKVRSHRMRCIACGAVSCLAAK